MGFLATLFGKILGFLYYTTHNYGITIIIFTILTRLIILPITLKQLKQSKAMAVIQPKMKSIQNKYKDNKEVLNQKMLELYKEHNYNPLSGCLPMIVQLFVLVGLYQAIKEPMQYIFFTEELTKEATHQAFLWIPNLSLPDLLDNIIPTSVFAYSDKIPGLMPIISAVLTYFSMQLTPGMSTPKDKNDTNSAPPGSNVMGFMKVFMPLLILFYGRTFTGGLVLYWTVGTIFSITQQHIFNKIKEKDLVDGGLN